MIHTFKIFVGGRAYQGEDIAETVPANIGGNGWHVSNQAVYFDKGGEDSTMNQMMINFCEARGEGAGRAGMQRFFRLRFYQQRFWDWLSWKFV